MIVREITIDEAKRVLFNSELFNRISDGRGRHQIEFENGLYVGGFTSDILRCVGIIYDRGLFQSVHINITKKHRAKLGIIFGKNLLKYTEDKPLLTNIPKSQKNVTRFAEYFKFVLIGEKDDQLIYRRG